MVTMPVVLVPVEMKLDEYNNGNVPPNPPKGFVIGGGSMNNNDYVTRSELKLTEQKLNDKVELSQEKLSGKIDVLNAKLDSFNDNITGLSSKVNWVFALIIGSILVPIFIKLFIK